MAFYKCAGIYATRNSNTEINAISGNIIKFTSSLSMPLMSCKTNFSAKQDLHGQSGSYPAGGQLWDEVWELGSISTVTGEKSGSTANIRTKNVIKVTENTRYSIVKPSGNQMFILFYRSDNTVIQYVQNTGDIGVYNLAATVNASVTNGTFTTPAETDYIMFRWDGITTYSAGVSINYPSTDTSYHPYSNICPINGVSGIEFLATKKNIFIPEDCVLENYYEVNPDRTVKVLASNSKSWDTLPEIPIKAGTYTVSKTVAGGRLTIRTALSNYESNAIALLDGQTSASFTIAEDTKFRIKIMTSYSSYPVDVGIMIELGSTATNYQANSYSYLGLNFGFTFFGGSIDLTNGILTNSYKTKIKIRDIGYWNYSETGKRFYVNNVSDVFRKTDWAEHIGLCDCYKEGKVGNNRGDDFAFGFYDNSLYIRDSMYTDVNEWINAVGDYYITYKLAVPNNISFEHRDVNTFVGINSMWANSGDILSIEYRNITQGG